MKSKVAADARSQRLQQWKNALAPREIELSVGTAMIRPVRVEDLVVVGTIPVTLLSKLDNVTTTFSQMSVDESPGDDLLGEVVEITPAINAIVIAAMVDPPVTLHGDDESLAVTDIPYEDRITIFAEAQRPVTALQSFREQPAGSDDAASDGEDLRTPAE